MPVLAERLVGGHPVRRQPGGRAEQDYPAAGWGLVANPRSSGTLAADWLTVFQHVAFALRSTTEWVWFPLKPSCGNLARHPAAPTDSPPWTALANSSSVIPSVPQADTSGAAWHASGSVSNLLGAYETGGSEACPQELPASCVFNWVWRLDQPSV